MAYYYVKSGGTAAAATDDGRFATQQTGAFSGLSDYYDNIDDATEASTSLTDGDYILVSDTHNKSYAPGSGINLSTGGTIGSGAGVRLISVSDTDITAYSPGAKETITDTNSVVVPRNALIAGVSFQADNSSQLLDFNNGIIVRLQDMTLTADNAVGADWWKISSTSDGMMVHMRNVDLECRSNSNAIQIGYGGTVIWEGGAIIGSSNPNTFVDGFGNGGWNVLIRGVDLSQATALSESLVVAADTINYRIENCKLNASVTLPSPTTEYQRFELYNSDDSTSGEYHRFVVKNGWGTAANNDSTYVTATEAWSYDGTTKSSIEVTTSANCDHMRPFVFELPAQYIDLSQAASDVLTLELVYDANDISLDKESIAAFLVYPDGTTAVQANWVTSGTTVGAGNYGIDPLGSGTALDTSGLTTGSWTGLGSMTTATVGAMQLDTSGDAGAATVCSVRIEVYKASIASGDLFIHPLITTS